MKQGRKTAAIESDGAEDYGKYNAARAKREAANAELAELVLKEKEGELVEVASVKREADSAAREVKNAFLALPERISSILVGRTEKEILFELRKEVKETLEMVADRVQ